MHSPSGPMPYDGAALTFSASELGDARAGFALSFGSCSFDEPVHELTAAAPTP